VLSEPFLVSRAVDVVKPYVKWACEPLRAEDVPTAIARGYYLAVQPPCGPVFISVPMDDWNHACEALPVRKVRASVSPDPLALDEIVLALASTRKLGMVAGAGIEEDHAWQGVVALAEHLNADVYCEPIPSRWTFPRTHPLFRGGLLPGQRPLAGQLADYDTVLVLGAPIFLYYACVPGESIKPGTQLFQITNSPVDASAALAGMSVVGNIAVAVEYLRNKTARVAPQPATRRPKPPEPKPENPITAAYVFSVLNKMLPPHAIIAEECPSSKGDLDRYLLLDEPGSFYSTRNGILGFGLPLALGLQLARPDRRVIAPIGDGSAQYSIQSLWTAVQYNLPVIFVVLRNGDYSALKSFCDFTSVGRNVPGTDIPGIDMVKLAQGYGMNAREVACPEDLEPALWEALARQAACLISVNIRTTIETCMGMDLSVNPPNYG
jgi:benzoylformate decarboxylase